MSWIKLPSKRTERSRKKPNQDVFKIPQDVSVSGYSRAPPTPKEKPKRLKQTKITKLFPKREPLMLDLTQTEEYLGGNRGHGHGHSEKFYEISTQPQPSTSKSVSVVGGAAKLWGVSPVKPYKRTSSIVDPESFFENSLEGLDLAIPVSVSPKRKTMTPKFSTPPKQTVFGTEPHPIEDIFENSWDGSDTRLPSPTKPKNVLSPLKQHNILISSFRPPRKFDPTEDIFENSFDGLDTKVPLPSPKQTLKEKPSNVRPRIPFLEPPKTGDHTTGRQRRTRKEPVMQTTMELIADFDVIPQRELDDSMIFRTVRKKEDRAKLQGWACDLCRHYYKDLVDKGIISAAEVQGYMNKCSKHRADPRRPMYEQLTPPGVWDNTLPSTPELIERGILQFSAPTTPVRPKRHDLLDDTPPPANSP